jgi:hypothetical protein
MATEIGAVAVATVTVAVAAAGNSRGRQQSTTIGSIVAKTVVAVAMAVAAAATVATAAADNSRTGGQDISIAVWQQPPWSFPPLALLSLLSLSSSSQRRRAIIGDKDKSCGSGGQRWRMMVEDDLWKDGGLAEQRGTDSEIVISPPLDRWHIVVDVLCGESIWRQKAIIWLFLESADSICAANRIICGTNNRCLKCFICGTNKNRGHFVILSVYRVNKNTFYANRICKLVTLT